MTYTTSTIAASATPALDFMNALDPLLTAGGFTFVEQVIATYTHRIYKSPAASNGVADWYLILRRTTDSNTFLYVTVCEQWDAVNKKAIYYPPNSTAFGIPDSSFRINEPAGQLLTHANIYWEGVNLTASGFNYYLSATASRVYFGTRIGVSGSNGCWAGLYDDLLPTSISPMPLGMGNLVNDAVGNLHNINFSYNRATREPATSTSTSGNWCMQWSSSSSLFGSSSGVTGADPHISGNPYIAYRVALVSARATSGGWRGLLKDLVYVAVAPVAGDTLTLTLPDGVTTRAYVAFGNRGLFVDTTV